MAKVCVKCLVEKPLTEFCKCKQNKDGLKRMCKVCGAAYSRSWFHANKEEKDRKEIARQRARVWAEKNPERLKSNTRSYYLNNKSKIKNYGKRWRAANLDRANAAVRRARRARFEAKPDVFRAAYRAWYAANLDKAQAKIHRRRARRMASDGHVSARDLRDLREMSLGLCAYCLKATTKLTIEHVIALAAGGVHSPENLVMACRPCNYSKGAKGILWMVSALQRNI